MCVNGNINTNLLWSLFAIFRKSKLQRLPFWQQVYSIWNMFTRMCQIVASQLEHIVHSWGFFLTNHPYFKRNVYDTGSRRVEEAVAKHCFIEYFSGPFLTFQWEAQFNTTIPWRQNVTSGIRQKLDFLGPIGSLLFWPGEVGHLHFLALHPPAEINHNSKLVFFRLHCRKQIKLFI